MCNQSCYIYVFENQAFSKIFIPSTGRCFFNNNLSKSYKHSGVASFKKNILKPIDVQLACTFMLYQ